MRIVLLLLVSMFLSCNKSEVVESTSVEIQIQKFGGYFILEDDFLLSNLNGIQVLETEFLTVAYDYQNSILWFETDEHTFPDWRYLKIAMDGIETKGKYDIQSYTSTYSEIQLNEDLNFFINENQDAPIFFHLNIEI